ncbi:MAG: ATP-binding protein [Clostridiales bacterium]|nr:ATP-binding protein [Clostridiales bacterium]
MKRYYVIIGNFGSGKTELALNMAFDAAKKGEKVTLVDIDVINPYFRSTERKPELEAAGIRLISPNFTTSGVEVPSIPPEIFSVFSDNSDLVIFDVGGDPVGAIAMGQYYGYFKELENFEVWYVINIRRPLSSGTPENLEMIGKICGVSRLKVTGILNNTNLAHETTIDDLLDGVEVTRELTKATGLPVIGTIGTPEVLSAFLEEAKKRNIPEELIGRPFPIERYMHRDWGRYVEKGL